MAKYKNAIISFEKSIKINPNYDMAYYHLGGIYGNQNDLKKAIFYYDKAIKINPNKPKYYEERANIYYDLGYP